MAKNVIHVADNDPAIDLPKLLEHVRAGAEVVIEHDARPVAVLKSTTAGPGRLLSESIRAAEENASSSTLDRDFGRDLEEIIKSHSEPLKPPSWD
jgi:antitoxin (DNA-binding transcriptional repressor) of toxin-antitoxin stability system